MPRLRSPLLALAPTAALALPAAAGSVIRTVPQADLETLDPASTRLVHRNIETKS